MATTRLCEICDKPAVYDNRWACSKEHADAYMDFQLKGEYEEMFGPISEEDFRKKFEVKREWPCPEHLKSFKEARTPEDILEVIKQEHWKSFCGCVKPIYNAYIGWALPSEKSCQLIVKAFEKHLEQYPQAKLVDLGAGTGVYSMMLNYYGIPKEKLVAVDNGVRKYQNCFEPELKEHPHFFWPVQREYEIAPHDVLFIAWGEHSMRETVNTYVNNGGTCVIIQGETQMTFPNNYLEDKDKDNWNCSFQRVLSPVNSPSELLSVNTR